MQRPVQPFAYDLNGVDRVGGVAEVELDVIVLAARPGAALIERLPGTGQHAPAFGGEFLDRGMADTAARAGEEEIFCHG